MKTIRTLLTASIALALAACQTTPPQNTDLVAARSTLSQARSNPGVARSGAVELERALQAMSAAETAWATDRNVDETRHLAYIARQRAEIALAVGRQADADLRVQQAGVERERVQLDARSREADVATENARVAQADANTAKASAVAAQGAAQTSRNEAELSREQADAARLLAIQQSDRAAGLERDLQDLKGRNTERGMVVTLGDVLFDTGRSTLQPGAQRSVEQLVQVLIRHPERRVLIEGFTDSVGSEEMNLQLSRRRAETFQQQLTNGGIATDRIEVRAWGEANPVADNGTAAGRQQNRRVEVLFSDAAGRIAVR
ncbi:MAG: OmpA family protein [Burkholderiaceae bacterium]|nr:OmpA family protein [Burkholderiaceae bacterium]